MLFLPLRLPIEVVETFFPSEWNFAVRDATSCQPEEHCMHDGFHASIDNVTASLSDSVRVPSETPPTPDTK